MTQSKLAAVEARDVVVALHGVALCRNLSFTVPVGTTLGIVGQPRAAEELIQCLVGRSKVAAGSLQVFGIDATSRWRLRSHRVFVPFGKPIPDSSSERPVAYILDRPELTGKAGDRLRTVLGSESSIVLTGSRPDDVAAFVAGLVILARGRLLWSGPTNELSSRFRRLRYVTHLTENRIGPGTELDGFDAIAVRVRGWGIEAIVSNFDPRALEKLASHEHVSDVVSEPVTLSEIVEATRSGGDG